jgi:hypothetical protein
MNSDILLAVNFFIQPDFTLGNIRLATLGALVKYSVHARSRGKRARNNKKSSHTVVPPMFFYQLVSLCSATRRDSRNLCYRSSNLLTWPSSIVWVRSIDDKEERADGIILENEV